MQLANAKTFLYSGEPIDEEFVKPSSRKKKTAKGKYYQNFDFFFKRSCFRTMTEFYKEKY